MRVSWRPLVLLLQVFHCRSRLLPKSPRANHSLLSSSSISAALKTLFLAELTRTSPARASSIRENIATTASRIPGFGPSNIVYPNYFEGIWNVEKEISEYTINDKKLQPNLDLINVLQAYQGLKLSYQEKYLNYNQQIIQDRLFSCSSYYKALFKEPYILTAWDISNPNLLTVSRTSGQITEIKVTKRSIESPPSDAKSFAVGYSEYARVAQVEGSLQSGVPQLYGLRKLVRIKREVEDGKKLQGVERTYLYSGDTLDLAADPLVTVKSRFTMTRVE